MIRFLCRLLCLLLLAFILPVNTALSQPLQDKIGQMIMVGLPPGEASKDTLINDIVDRNLGGVLMFAYNIASPDQIKHLNAELQSYRTDHLLISVDQEGGIVARLDEQNGYRQTHTAETLGETFASEDSTRAQARMMARWLREAGFNVNFAPVVDVNVYRSSPAIGRLGRSFSGNEHTVFEHARWFIDEFNEQNIATALKHFPGHGSARSDSHNGFTDISDTWQDRELYPFVQLIENGYSDLIMTGHLFNRDWDDQYPASLSRAAITTKLRGELGFEGVVISDELFMRAVQENYGFDEAVVQAINAGTDILLFNTNIHEGQSLTRYVIDLVSRKVDEGEIDPALIDAAYYRIQKLKTERIATSSERIPGSGLPAEIEIHNHPNPFNSRTVIGINLPVQQQLRVEVFNTLGQHVRTLAHAGFMSGDHHLAFDGSGLPMGIYIIRVFGEHFQIAHRISLLK